MIKSQSGIGCLPSAVQYARPGDELFTAPGCQRQDAVRLRHVDWFGCPGDVQATNLRQGFHGACGALVPRQLEQHRTHSTVLVSR